MYSPVGIDSCFELFGGLDDDLITIITLVPVSLCVCVNEGLAYKTLEEQKTNFILYYTILFYGKSNLDQNLGALFN